MTAMLGSPAFICSSHFLSRPYHGSLFGPLHGESVVHGESFVLLHFTSNQIKFLSWLWGVFFAFSWFATHDVPLRVHLKHKTAPWSTFFCKVPNFIYTLYSFTFLPIILAWNAFRLWPRLSTRQLHKDASCCEMKHSCLSSHTIVTSTLTWLDGDENERILQLQV